MWILVVGISIDNKKYRCQTKELFTALKFSGLVKGTHFKLRVDTITYVLVVYIPHLSLFVDMDVTSYALELQKYYPNSQVEV